MTHLDIFSCVCDIFQYIPPLGVICFTFIYITSLKVLNLKYIWKEFQKLRRSIFNFQLSNIPWPQLMYLTFMATSQPCQCTPTPVHTSVQSQATFPILTGDGSVVLHLCWQLKENWNLIYLKVLSTAQFLVKYFNLSIVSNQVVCL